jgi:hypothetical protein
MLRRFGENTSIEVSCVTPPESVDATESSNPCEVQDGDWHLERLVGETSLGSRPIKSQNAKSLFRKTNSNRSA